MNNPEQKKIVIVRADPDPKNNSCQLAANTICRLASIKDKLSASDILESLKADEAGKLNIIQFLQKV